MRTLLLALSAIVLLASPLTAQQDAARTNIVLIMVDDLGWADLGCYGGADIKTPNIDGLALQGVRLTNFYSNGPVCTPTRAALMTGRWQQRVGLEWGILVGQKAPGLPPAETSLARMLKDGGCATGMFGKWHLGYRKECGPNAHGFDEFYGLLSGNVDSYSHLEVSGEPDWYQNTEPVQADGYSTDLITDHALDFINRNSGRPFFAYIAYNAPHFPFQPPHRPDLVRNKESWTAGTRELDYAGMVEAMDAGVGRILRTLDEHHLADKTLVIFTDDNGGERLSNNGPFFNHKETVWEGGIRVPCIFRGPGLPAGATSDQAGITMDLTATILAAAGISPSRALDGIDLAPILSGQTAQVERTFCWRINTPTRKQKAIRKGDWKLVDDAGINLLFNLPQDPGERTDLSWKYPDRLAELQRLLGDWESDVTPKKPAPPQK